MIIVCTSLMTSVGLLFGIITYETFTNLSRWVGVSAALFFLPVLFMMILHTIEYINNESF